MFVVIECHAPVCQYGRCSLDERSWQRQKAERPPFLSLEKGQDPASHLLWLLRLSYVVGYLYTV